MQKYLTLVQTWDSPTIPIEKGKQYSMIVAEISVWSDGETRLHVNLQEMPKAEAEKPQADILDDI